MARWCWGLWAMLAVLSVFLCANAEAGLDADRIAADTLYLCEQIGIREAGTEAERQTCDWLEGRMTALGFSSGAGSLRRVAFRSLEEKTSENLIAVCNAGSQGPLFTIVAHYDSVSTSPGARDNAAAVGILLDIARLLGPECASLPCEIHLALVGSEENGYHGARSYVAGLSEAEKARHQGAFVMDISAASPDDHAVLVTTLLGGRLPDGQYAAAERLPALENGVTRAVSAACQELSGIDAPSFYRGESDHQPFHDAGLEAANVCWRRVEEGWPWLPDSYHQASDTPQELDYETAVLTGRCIVRAIELLTLSTQ